MTDRCTTSSWPRPATSWRAEGIVAEMIEPGGDPAHAIERVAEQGRFDTIVVGSRGLNAAERFLQGSVSEHVATHASATVVVAR